MRLEKNRYFCIFGGGGIRGIAYLGAVKALNELNIKIDGCAGSSVGAVFATLYQIGYTLDEIKEIFFKTNFGLFKDISIDFLKVFSITKGDHFLNWIRELIEKKFYGEDYKEFQSKPVTFKDLNKELVILSVNLTNSTYKEFSKYETPDIEIAQAVRASVSIPGFFKPVEFDSNFLVDGDLIKSWPLWRLSKNLCPPDKKVLEFRLEDEQKDRKITTGIEYINAVYNVITACATDFIMDLYSKKDKFDYIRINSKNIGVLDFMIREKTREELLNIGYNSTISYFKEEYPKKCINIDKTYAVILDFLNEVKQLFESSKYKEAKSKLFELFVFLCEGKMVIDVLKYKSIVKFKDLFLSNCIEKQIFLVKTETVSNKQLILSSLNQLIQEIQ